jgi:hypothetical protein
MKVPNKRANFFALQGIFCEEPLLFKQKLMQYGVTVIIAYEDSFLRPIPELCTVVLRQIFRNTS